jgi:hypothetical protein
VRDPFGNASTAPDGALSAEHERPGVRDVVLLETPKMRGGIGSCTVPQRIEGSTRRAMRNARDACIMSRLPECRIACAQTNSECVAPHREHAQTRSNAPYQRSSALSSHPRPNLNLNLNLARSIPTRARAAAHARVFMSSCAVPIWLHAACAHGLLSLTLTLSVAPLQLEPVRAGTHVVRIKLRGVEISGSPLSFKVSPGAPSVQKCFLTKPIKPAIEKVAYPVVATLVDKYGNRLDRGGVRVDAKALGAAATSTVEGT